MFEGGGGGPGTGMQTDSAQLRSAGIEAGTVAEGLDTMLRNLMGRLEPLMSRWMGQAGMSFQNVRAEYDIEMGKLNTALRTIGDKVGLSEADYVNADEEMASDLMRAGATEGQITALLNG